MPKKVDHDARREELVLAAWRVIAANGIDEVTIRDIAHQDDWGWRGRERVQLSPSRT